MAYIEISDLRKIYKGNKVIQDISLFVEQGEFVVLVGPSGCGKTTTLRLISGLILPDGGQIMIDGQDITNLPAEKRDVVMVFQDTLLFPHLTVSQNIGFGLKMKKIKNSDIQQKVQHMLKIVQLEGLGDRYPDQLSGGQRQRVALARALALEPKVLLLDEPLSCLDPALRGDMRDFILKIHKELNMTTICVTHDSEEALHMADHVAAMFEGKIVQYAIPQDIYYKPATGRVAHLFGRCNILACKANKGLLYWLDHAVSKTSLEDGEVVVFVRPECIRLKAELKDDAFKGIVDKTVFIGEKNLVFFTSSGLDLVACYWGKEPYKPGDQIYFQIRWDECFQRSGGIENEDFNRCSRSE